MRKTSLNRFVLSAFIFAVFSFAAVSCVDSDYDLNEDIDMTVGIGSEGLKFKLGSTQKILMKNVLEVDEDFRTDASNMYYLIESGSTQTDFRVGGISSTIEDVRYTTDQPVIDYDKISSMLGGMPSASVSVPAGWPFDSDGTVTATGNFKYDVTDIDDVIVSLERLNFSEGVKVQIALEIEEQGMDFNFVNVNGMEITVPENIEIVGFSNGTVEGNKIKVNDIERIYNNTVVLGQASVRAMNIGEYAITPERTMHIEETVNFRSSFSFESAAPFDVNPGDYVNVSAVLKFIDSNGTPASVSVKSAVGKFDPLIEPDIDDIDISSGLPDFLKGDDVTIAVSNPTLKFRSDMSSIPVKLAFNMRASSKKNGAETAAVWFPGEYSKAYLNKNSVNALYFHQNSGGPYDPSGVEPSADKYLVPGISDLLYKLPDFISIDLSGGKVKVDNTENTLVELNRTYNFAADYDVFVPLQFDEGLKIVYTDSLDNINKDIQDYEADSAAISAVIDTDVPLDLYLDMVPVDVSGRVIPSIHVDKVKINASDGKSPKSTEVYLNIRLDNRRELKKLDKLMMRITAGSISSGRLTSQQYIQARDIRLILKGQVICDFN